MCRSEAEVRLPQCAAAIMPGSAARAFALAGLWLIAVDGVRADATGAGDYRGGGYWDGRLLR